LDMGFIHDIRRILALLPVERQNLLFSATFPEEIRKLAGTFMKDPITVEVARRNTPAELVSQVAHPVDSGRKRELLAHLVKANDWKQVLVFCKTKHGANRLAQQLSREGVNADAIHGNKSQNARTRALEQFKEGSMRVLVATDIAARGLDIEALPHVVNYDLPHVAEDYVHRIGRTGRAGAEGEAVSLVSHEDRPLLAAIEKLMNRTVEQKVIAGFEPGTAMPRTQPQQREPRPFSGRGANRNRPPQRQRDGRPQFKGPRPAQGSQRSPQRPLPPANSERDAQIREARARMMEDGEVQPAGQRPQAPLPGNGQRPRPGGEPRQGNGAGRGNGARRARRGGGRGQRNNRADPRREQPYAEPGERGERRPSAHHNAAPRPAPVIQVKQRRTLVGFVGSLLGRKTEEEKS
ncbi:MAG TPA: helicase-related protein, partial [Burkholderiales bacterium]|nr:helicase-related protein [Burkholderiales bacterium]